jgi:hypothetical protein
VFPNGEPRLLLDPDALDCRRIGDAERRVGDTPELLDERA